jgi:hypothetical protein
MYVLQNKQKKGSNKENLLELRMVKGKLRTEGCQTSEAVDSAVNVSFLAADEVKPVCGKISHGFR